MAGENSMEKYKIGIDDIKNNYFHFTNKNNFESIKSKGLVPKKGHHAEFIEKSEKVFFVQGLDNMLILFDSWINVYLKIPKLFCKKTGPQRNRETKGTRFIYKWGAKAMSSKYFPMFLVDIYFLAIKNNKNHKMRAYDLFDEILKESILFNLNITPGVEFLESDLDEIKSKGYRRRHLIELGYSKKYSNVYSCEMEKWNMHTLTNHGIDESKLKLCSINGSVKLQDIFVFILENTKLDVENICPVLFGYLEDRNLDVHIKKK